MVLGYFFHIKVLGWFYATFPPFPGLLNTESLDARGSASIIDKSIISRIASRQNKKYYQENQSL